ncbi:MAG: hypothetical protein AAFX50_16615, partial [Acidobacteriota bacterium]
LDPGAHFDDAAGGELDRRVEVERDGQTQTVVAPYRFRQTGAVETPRTPMAGGGSIAVSGIDPASGQVRLQVAAADSGPVPARLSVDVTTKPLIKLVWYGLYVVLFGGLISTLKRLKHSRRLDRSEMRAAAAGG